MAIMMEKLYSALRRANVPEDEATAAAIEAASYENRLASVESTLRLHTWILSTNTAGILILLGLALRGHS
jgi:hypothetical protein